MDHYCRASPEVLAAKGLFKDIVLLAMARGESFEVLQQRVAFFVFARLRLQRTERSQMDLVEASPNRGSMLGNLGRK
jgi:hypothetical protein